MKASLYVLTLIFVVSCSSADNEIIMVDLEKMEGFPTADLAYDRQEKAIFRYAVYNDDFTSRQQVTLSTRPVNNEIAITQSLEALDLVKAYEKGELKGELREIAAKLDFESNPVIMLIKHKETK